MCRRQLRKLVIYMHSKPKNRASRSLITLGWLILIAAGLTLPGCGGEVQAKLDDYLEELEFDTPLDTVKELQIGTHHARGYYRISLAATSQGTQVGLLDSNWLQVRFKLFVVVAPENEKAVMAAMERHRGKIDDVVGSVCRKLTLEELDDFRLIALKAHMIDELRPLLGEDRVRQVIFSDFKWEPI